MTGLTSMMGRMTGWASDQINNQINLARIRYKQCKRYGPELTVFAICTASFAQHAIYNRDNRDYELNNGSMVAAFTAVACIALYCASTHLVDKIAKLIIASGDPAQKKGIALCLKANDRSLADGLGRLKNLHELSKDFVAEERIVGDVQELVAAINGVNESSKLPIRVLIINGHGNSDSLELSENSYLYGTENELRNEFDKLAPDGIIILNSCSTGKKNRNGTCIAERIAELANHRKVFAPTEDVYESLFYRGFAIERSTKGLKQALIPRFFSYVFSRLPQNMTAVFER